jgi:hypothetical protein
MAKRQIGTPRFYCDVLSYLKSIGKYNGVSSIGWGEVPNKEKPFTMNPYQPYGFNLPQNIGKSRLRFWINEDPVATGSMNHIPQHELGKLLAYHNPSDDEHHSSGWFAGILGHNLASLETSAVHHRFYGKHDDNTIKFSNQSEFKEIVNFEEATLIEPAGSAGKPKYDGFSLWEITNKNTSNLQSRFSVAEFTFEKNDGNQNEVPWGDNNSLEIGAFTAGIFIEAPNSPDLSVKKTLEMSGISVNETIAGNTLVNIKHKGVPNWGNQPAWTLQKTDGRDYTNVANRARRIWDMSFSYISDDNLFDAAQNSNSFFNDTFDQFDDEETYSVSNFDTSMSSFFKLTQNGALPFIFCPDSKATRIVDGVEVDNPEFAICMLDQDSISCTQVAHRTWNVSLAIREVY